MACGGVNGGYTLFIADHKLHYEYNYFNVARYAIVSPTLPTGKVDLKFNFIKTGMLKGIGRVVREREQSRGRSASIKRCRAASR